MPTIASVRCAQPAEPPADIRTMSSASQDLTPLPVALTRGGHRPQLDALRCFAVLGVLVTHFWQPGPYPGILQHVDLGFLGVRLFFVLSGFLITGILLDARDHAVRAGLSQWQVLGRFYGRRVLRIFPLYYLIVLGGLLVGVPRAREAWPWLLTYTSNFYQALEQQSVGYYGHFWTLAVEEQFYLVWPWLVLFAPRRSLALIMIAAVAMAPVYRDVVFGLLGTRGWDTLPFGSLDTLGVGALLAIAFRDASAPEELHARLQRLVLPIGLGSYALLNALALSDGGVRWLVALHEISYALICCWLIAGAYRGFCGLPGRLLEARPVVYLGRISYGIYAYHMQMPWLLQRVFAKLGWAFPGHGPARLLLAGAVTVLVAMASWQLVERPINALKRHVPYD